MRILSSGCCISQQSLVTPHNGTVLLLLRTCSGSTDVQPRGAIGCAACRATNAQEVRRTKDTIVVIDTWLADIDQALKRGQEVRGFSGDSTYCLSARLEASSVRSDPWATVCSDPWATVCSDP